MNTIINWKGLYYHSSERCMIDELAAENRISSRIKGDFEANKYILDYAIHTNETWETIEADITAQINGTTEMWRLKRQFSTWLLNGKPLAGCDDAIDIDISLTPLTNTLPIRRLQMQAARSQIIEVVYFDILNKEVKPVKQIYTRLSAQQYQFENFNKDFKAVLQVNTQGLVVDYPGLFEKINE